MLLNQPIVIGALVATIYILGEVLKLRSQRRNGHFKSEDHQMLHDLYVSHSRVDGDGIPVWYVPRRMLKDSNVKLDDILSELKKMNSNFNSLTKSRLS